MKKPTPTDNFNRYRMRPNSRPDHKFPSWCCQRCGDPVGWLGRGFMVLDKNWHKCTDPHKENIGI